PAKVSALVPVDYQAQHRLVAFALETDGKQQRLHIAVEDPADTDAIDELRFQMSKVVKVYVAAADDIESALAELKGEKLEIIEPLALDDDDDGGDVDVVEGKIEDSDAPVAE